MAGLYDDLLTGLPPASPTPAAPAAPVAPNSRPGLFDDLLKGLPDVPARAPLPPQRPAPAPAPAPAPVAPAAMEYDALGNATGMGATQPVPAAAPAPAPAPPQQPAFTPEPGNIDLNNRPRVKMPDGKIATVRSMGFTREDGSVILLPSISRDGQVMTPAQALEYYKLTGEHLGTFRNKDEADRYADQLHRDQERLYAKPKAQPKPKQGKLASPDLQGPMVPMATADASASHELPADFRGRDSSGSTGEGTRDPNLTLLQGVDSVNAGIAGAEKTLLEARARRDNAKSIYDTIQKSLAGQTPRPGSRDANQLLTAETDFKREQMNVDAAIKAVAAANKRQAPTLTAAEDARRQVWDKIGQGAVGMAGGAALIFENGGDSHTLSKSIHKAADDYSKWIATDPNRADEFVSQLAGGFGSTIPFVLGGYAAAAAKVPAMLASGALGALQNADDSYRKAEQLGQKGWQLAAAYLSGAGIGATEAFGLGRLATLNAATNGAVSRYFAAILIETGEEGFQEGLQTLLSNLQDRGLFDEDKPISQDIGRNALVGAILGFAMTGVSHAPHFARDRANELRNLPLPPGDPRRAVLQELTVAPAPQVGSAAGIRVPPYRPAPGAPNVQSFSTAAPGAHPAQAPAAGSPAPAAGDLPTGAVPDPDGNNPALPGAGAEPGQLVGSLPGQLGTEALEPTGPSPAPLDGVREDQIRILLGAGWSIDQVEDLAASPKQLERELHRAVKAGTPPFQGDLPFSETQKAQAAELAAAANGLPVEQVRPLVDAAVQNETGAAQGGTAPNSNAPGDHRIRPSDQGSDAATAQGAAPGILPGSAAEATPAPVDNSGDNLAVRDPYGRAVELVQQAGKASIADVQAALASEGNALPFEHVGRLFELMQQAGVLGPAGIDGFPVLQARPSAPAPAQSTSDIFDEEFAALAQEQSADAIRQQLLDYLAALGIRAEIAPGYLNAAVARVQAGETDLFQAWRDGVLDALAGDDAMRAAAQASNPDLINALLPPEQDDGAQDDAPDISDQSDQSDQSAEARPTDRAPPGADDGAGRAPGAAGQPAQQGADAGRPDPQGDDQSVQSADAGRAGAAGVPNGVSGSEPVLSERPPEGASGIQHSVPGGWPHALMAPADIFPAPDKKLFASDQQTETLTPEQAAERLAEWKEVIRQINEEEGEENSAKVVLSLFDRTGNWSRPWDEAGYQVVTLDIKTGKDLVRFFPSSLIDDIKRDESEFEIVGVLAAPPCTSFASSGARWWKSQHDVPGKVEEKYGLWAQKYFDTPLEYAQTLVAVTQAIIELANPTQFHVLENPIGRIQAETGLPSPTFVFNPHNYGDPFTKTTQLWGVFNTNLPQANVAPTEGSLIAKLRGYVEEQKLSRSETPEGFAYAFFMANHPGAMERWEKLRNGAKKPAKDRTFANVETPKQIRDLVARGTKSDGSAITDDEKQRWLAEADRLEKQNLAKIEATEAEESAPASREAFIDAILQESGTDFGPWVMDRDEYQVYRVTYNPRLDTYTIQTRDADGGRDAQVTTGPGGPREKWSRGEAADRAAEKAGWTGKVIPAKNPTADFGKTPALEMPGVYGTPDKPLKFFSGMSRSRDFIAVLEAGGHAGITIKELSTVSIPKLAEALTKAQSGYLFVDSGALSDFTENLRRKARGEPATGGLDFDAILKKYDELHEAIARIDENDTAAHRVFFVMPDVVGDQKASLDLVKKYADRINETSLRAIVPLQVGELSFTEAYEAMMRNLGLDPAVDTSPVIGIPSREEAVSNEEFKALLDKHGDRIDGIHILGAASDKSLAPRLKVLSDAGYDWNTSADANRLRALIRKKMKRPEALRKLLAPTETKSTADIFDEELDALKGEEGASNEPAKTDKPADYRPGKDAPLHERVARAGVWWEQELTRPGRRRALNMSGHDVKRDLVKWWHLTESEQHALTDLFESGWQPTDARSAELTATFQAHLENDGGYYTVRVEDGQVKLPGKYKTQTGLFSALYDLGWQNDGYDVSTGFNTFSPRDGVTTQPLTVKRTQDAKAPATKKAPKTAGASASDAAPKGPRVVVNLVGKDGLTDAERTAAEAAKSAVKNTVMGLDQALDGIEALFGDKNTLGSGPTFDEDTYRKAIPFFRAALRHFKAAADDVRGMVKALLRYMTTVRKTATSTIERMKPYIVRFVDDVHDGKISLEDDDGRDLHPLGQDGEPEAPGDHSGRLPAPEPDHPGLDGQSSEHDEDAAQGGASEPTGTRPVGEDAGSGDGQHLGGDAADGRPGASGEGLAAPGTGGRDRLERQPSATRPNYHVSDPESLVGGTPKKRFAANKAAIETFRDLTETGRDPTQEDLDALASYVGWGSFGQELFQGTWQNPRPKYEWQAEDKWLRNHLGQQEWESARDSIINAHYTDPPTVQAMWDIVRALGFPGGRVLEPSMGIGNFYGMMPRDLMSASDLTGIELDRLTGGMAKLLYPHANIQIKGYQASHTADGFYDLVIGNWPFSEVSPADRRYDKLNLTLHDYFFAKAIDQVRPGGIVIGITSAGTLDKAGRVARGHLARQAELVAAFRLPSGAFEKYAGTKVVTDIVILRKRPKPLTSASDIDWVHTEVVKTPSGEEIRLNRYYVQNPGHVLGTLDYGHGTTTFHAGMIVHRPDDLMERLQKLKEQVPQAYEPIKRGEEPRFITNNIDARQRSVVLKDDELYQVQGERLVLLKDVFKYETGNKAETQKRYDQIAMLTEMRERFGRLMTAERTGSGDAEGQRAELRRLYEDFTKAFGPIKTSYGLKALKQLEDPSAPQLQALEKKDGTPAKILTERTVRTPRKLAEPSVRDAFVLARNETVTLDLERIAALAKTTVARVKGELLQSGAIFRTPGGGYEVADVYLSGNVRRKLREAIDAKELGEDMDGTIAALQKALPKDVPYFQIEAKLGATWVQPEHYVDFIADLLGANAEQKAAIKIEFTNGAWKVKFTGNNTGFELNRKPEATTTWGYPAINFHKLITNAMNNQVVKIWTTDENNKPVIDEGRSREANEKAARLREEFSGWIWRDAERRVVSEKNYNEIMNAIATPHYDGSFLEFPGMTLTRGDEPFNLRAHQANAIWRGIVNGRGVYAHEVGTGKTYTMGGIAVESRRYGIASKPLIVAHNANSATVAREINEMYPGAAVLYIDNLAPDEIDATLHRIGNDDWDAIVIPHSLVDRLALKEETLMEMAAEEIAALEQEAIAAAREDGITLTVATMDDEGAMKKVRSSTAKQLVKQRQKIIEKIQKLGNRASAEGAVAFEDLGVDMILIDEIHEFKKPPIATRMAMRGLNRGTSDRSITLRFLTDYVKKMRAGKGVHSFTGTPITNTLTEIYNQARYVMDDDMERDGIKDWDAWFNTFADAATDVELTAAGDYEPVTRLASFVNVAELRRMIGQYMDIVFADEMPEFAPRADRDGRSEKNPVGRPYKKIINDVAPMGPVQKAVQDLLKERSKTFRNATKKRRRELMLSGDPSSPIIVETAASNAGLDVRLYDMGAPDEPQAKVNRVIPNVLKHYREHPQATQVIFMERGYSAEATRRKTEADGSNTVTHHQRFKLVGDIIEKLTLAGIPRNEIAVVDGKVSKERRKEIADAMNDGTIRVVIGLTSTLGVGVNMQNNLRAMHHMDAPWTPGELEQRNGRGWRQGNKWNTVLEYRYITEGLDGRRWQVLAIKDRFIKAFMKADDNVRVIDGDAVDMSEQGDLAATLSEAAGDPRLLLLNKYKGDVTKLEGRERLHSFGVADARQKARELERRNDNDRDALAAIKQDVAYVATLPEGHFRAEIGGEVFENFDLTERRIRDGFASAQATPEQTGTAEIAGKTTAVTKPHALKGKKHRLKINTDARTKAQEALDKQVKTIAKGEARDLGTVQGFTFNADWKSNSLFSEVPYYSVVRKTRRGGFGASIASIEGSLRRLPEIADEYEKEIAEREQSIARMHEAAAQPFQQQQQLDARRKALTELEADIQANPVPAPAWLRHGAPVGTLIYVDGKPRTVTGHKHTDTEYQILTEDGPVEYSRAMSEDGGRLFETVPFTPPPRPDRRPAAHPGHTGSPDGDGSIAKASLIARANRSADENRQSGWTTAETSTDVNRVDVGHAALIFDGGADGMEQLEPLFQNLNTMLEGVLPEGAKLVVAHRLTMSADALAEGYGELARGRASNLPVSGFYHPAHALIAVALGPYDPAAVAWHEAWHAVKDMVGIKETDQRILERDRKRLYPLILKIGKQIRDSRTGTMRDLTEADLAKFSQEEIEASAVEAWSMGHRIREAHSVTRRFLDYMALIIARVKNWMKSDGFRASEDIIRDFMSGKLTREGEASGLRSQVPQGSFSPATRDNVEALNSQHGLPTPTPQRRPASFETPTETRLDRLRAWQQDEFAFLDKIQDAINRARGHTLAQLQDAKLAQKLYGGMRNAQLTDFHRRYVTPLTDEIKRSGLTPDQVGEWLIAQHAQERNYVMAGRDPVRFGADGGSGMADRTARDIIAAHTAAGRAPALNRIAQRVYDIIAFDRATRHDAGLLSDEEVQSWEDLFAYDPSMPFPTGKYVPLRGFAKDDALLDPYGISGLGNGMDLRGRESPHALGRMSLSDNPIYTAIHMAQAGIVRAEKNVANQALLRLAQSNPNPDVWEIVKAPGVPLKKRRYLDSNDTVAEMPNIWEKNDPNVIGIKVAGQQWFLKIKNPTLAAAYRDSGAGGLMPWLRHINTFTRFYSRMQTGLNPEFFIPNFARDVQEALTTVKARGHQGVAYRTFKNYFRGAFIGSVKYSFGGSSGFDPIIARWRAAGGEISVYDFKSLEEIQGDIERELQGLTQSAARRAPKMAWRGMIKGVENLNAAFENATRLAVFKAAIDSGMTDERAAARARDATIDFATRGSGSIAMNAAWGFYNVAVQGNAKQVFQLHRSPFARKLWAATAMVGIVQALVGYYGFAGGDDDDEQHPYTKVRDWERRTNFIIPIGMKRDAEGNLELKYAKIPAMFGLRIPLYFGERIGSVITGQITPQQAMWDTLLGTIDAFNPLGQGSLIATIAPTFLDPIAELWTNRNFQERPIYPEPEPWTEGLPKSSQPTSAATSPLATKTAEGINWATGGDKFNAGLVDRYPGEYEYLAGWLTGGAGRFVMNTAQTLYQAFTNPEAIVPERIPIVRRFYGVTDGGGESEVYYKEREKVTGQKNRFNAAKNAVETDPDNQAAQRTLERESENLNVRPRFGKPTDWTHSTLAPFTKTDKYLKELREEKAALPSSGKSAREQTLRSREIDQEIQSLMRDTRKRHREMTAPDAPVAPAAPAAPQPQKEEIGGAPQAESLWSSVKRTLGYDPDPITLERDAANAYPSDADADQARKAGFGYGGPEADINGERANIVGRDRVETLPPKKKGGKPSETRTFEAESAAGLSLEDATGLIDTRAKRQAVTDPKLKNTMTKAALAVNRNPVAALGYDPSRVAYDVKMDINRANIAGAYYAKTDGIYSNAGAESNVVHESIHRGIEMVRKRRPELFATLPDEEFVVRHIMRTQMGDPETGRGTIADKQIASARFHFETGPKAKQNQAALAAIDAEAQKMIQERRPRGPR